MKHLIITSSDRRYGDFLVDHWYRSLCDNVNLRGIDVGVLDYGLADVQRRRLEANGVLLHRCQADGNITNIRYRDMLEFLATRNYNQVLAIDGGDIIFQADIHCLFEQDQATFRGVCEERDIPFHDLVLPQTDMDRAEYQRMFDFLKGKPTVNGGVLFGPAAGFREMWKEFQEHCHSFNVFGTDQLIMNNFIYRNGFVALDQKYNFVVVAMNTQFQIREGVFYGLNGEVIPVVHNAGMQSMTRCIRKFGYGKDRNKRKWLTPFVLHSFFRLLNFYKRLRFGTQATV